YVASHGNDFLLANDAWARFINLKYSPDGNVYLIDWYDKQACHLPQPEVWDRSNGRIYKISYRGTKPAVGIDLQKCSDEELVQYQLHENEWYSRHARRILQERWAALERKNIDTNSAIHKQRIRDALWELIGRERDETRRLRLLWSLHAIGETSIGSLLKDSSPHVRGWTVQLLAEQKKVGPRAFAGMAASERSAVAWRYLVSAANRIQPEDRSAVLLPLLAAGRAYVTDQNLPYLL